MCERNRPSRTPAGPIAYKKPTAGLDERLKAQFCMHMAAPTSAVRVHDELRALILEGRLAPGERLRAEAVAERLGTSRTPVREALLMLEREGLVLVEPHRGAVVRAFDAADLLDLYEVRALIEPHAAHRAATRIELDPLARLGELCGLAERPQASVDEQIAHNEEFHALIAAAAGSPRLLAALRAVAGIPHAFRAAFWADGEQREQSLFCHRELTRALTLRRPELAEVVMRMHILGARDFLLRVLDDHG
jgi:DNA-binding GntR family transcriptional regulator